MNLRRFKKFDFTGFPTKDKDIAKDILSMLKMTFGSDYPTEAFEWYLDEWHNMSPDDWEDYEGDDDIEGDYPLFLINKYVEHITGIPNTSVYSDHPLLDEYLIKYCKFRNPVVAIDKIFSKTKL